MRLGFRLIRNRAAAISATIISWVLTASGIPEENTDYKWVENDPTALWDDSKIWTENI